MADKPHQLAEKKLGFLQGWEGLGFMEGTGQADPPPTGPGGHPSVSHCGGLWPPQPQSQDQGAKLKLA